VEEVLVLVFDQIGLAVRRHPVVEQGLRTVPGVLADPDGIAVIGVRRGSTWYRRPDRVPARQAPTRPADGYLASPIDLLPDFIPVLGYADDVLLVAIVLRSVLRHTGPDALGRHWPGTLTGLQLIERLAGRPLEA